MSDQLDHILDHALSEYRVAEPLAGIEDRILQRLVVQPARSSPLIRRIFGCPIPASFAGVGVFAVIAALIIAALWLGLRERPHQTTTSARVPHSTGGDSGGRVGEDAPNQTANAGAPLKPSLRLSGNGSSRLASSNSKLKTENLKLASNSNSKLETGNLKLTQFPAPAPMTSEEHALLALAQTHPRALLSSPDSSDQLSIAPIEIKPLAPETGATQGEP